ncbi:MAG TPA: LptE family protein [Thermoanaerobaculia bacterium]|nr:LptE family protein [Thermoanaerobaculia bacterium]
MKPCAAVSSILLLAACLSGCGYALVGRASNIPEDIREVYIHPFENRTQRSQVEQEVTRSIAEEMVNRQRFSVVGGVEESDAELIGAVTAFGVTPVTFDETGRATEYEISITAQVSFKRKGSDELIWSNDRYVFRESYPIDPDSPDYFDRENEAIREAAERFAESMVADLLEGF